MKDKFEGAQTWAAPHIMPHKNWLLVACWVMPEACGKWIHLKWVGILCQILLTTVAILQIANYTEVSSTETFLFSYLPMGKTEIWQVFAIRWVMIFDGDLASWNTKEKNTKWVCMPDNHWKVDNHGMTYLL